MVRVHAGQQKIFMLVKFFNKNYKSLGIILLILLGLIIYSNSLHNSFHFDDELSVTNNSAIRNIGNLRNIWNFYPARFIAHLSFSINYHFNHFDVFGYHLANLLIHIISAILVYFFILLTFSTPRMKDENIAKYANLIALFSALIFLTHPIQTQAVTYISQRIASLAALFYLASLIFYIQSRLLEEKLINGSIYYFLSLMMAVMAMFTKEITITLPLMVLFYEVYFFKAKRSIKLIRLTPFFITLLIIPLTMLVTRYVNILEMRLARDSITPISPASYLFTQFRVMVTYIRLLFLPINQNLDYDYAISKTLMYLPTLASLLFLISIIIIAKRISNKYKLISFGIVWFFLTLLPESSVIPIKDVIFEHRLYLPMVGYSFFLVSSIYYLLGKKTLKGMVIGLLMIVACYSIMTYARNFVWKDEFTLWNDTVHKSPNKARPYNNRGLAYQTKGNLEQAILDYNRAIAIEPNYVEAYSNRGAVYQNKGNLDQAFLDCNKAIEINPNYAGAYINRGNAHKDKGNPDQAFSDYNKAIEIAPNYAKAYNNRGNAHKAKGNLDQAILDYNKAIEIDPNLAEAYSNLGNAHKAKGNLNQAFLDYNKAIAINPDYADTYYNRGLAYQTKGNLDQAILDYNKAIEIKPDYADAYVNRGTVYQIKGNLDQAILDYNKAIEIDPNYADVYCNRGLAYQNQGNLDQAFLDYNKAIEIDPDYAGAYVNRAMVYFKKQEYTKSREDAQRAQILGYKVSPEFLEQLRKASGREE
jgi:protein O-mannosyl-transferase